MIRSINIEEARAIVIEIYAELQRDTLDADEAHEDEILELEDGDLEDSALEELRASMTHRGFDPAYPLLLSDIRQMWGGRHRRHVAVELELDEIHVLIAPHALLSRLEDNGAELEDMMSITLALRDLEDQGVDDGQVWESIKHMWG